MSTNIDNIIIVNEQEVITTSIDGYFRNVAIVARFENNTLNPDKTFDTSGVETYQSLNALLDKFPTTHPVYQIAKDIFTQKTNTGMNKSAVETVAVIQILQTDSSIEAGLARVGYADAYHFVLGSQADDDIESFVEYLADKRKIPHAQTNEPEVLTDSQVTPSEGDPYDNIAKKLKEAHSKAVLYYHANNEQSLAGAEASIHCYGVTGRISGVFDKPTGITVDKLTDTQKEKLDGNYVNYFCPYIGQAGKYMTRDMTAGGYLSNGTEIQKQIILDRIILNLQSAGMDALEMKVPYDDRGGAVLESKLKAVMRQMQNEEIIAQDSLADDGELVKGQTVEVLTRETVKKQFPSIFAKKYFVAKITAQIALNAKGVEIYLAYQA